MTPSRIGSPLNRVNPYVIGPGRTTSASYGFVLLRARADEALEQKLAGLGVELLGPHDDHHTARLPVASLHAIAALHEVEWIRVSARAEAEPRADRASRLREQRGSRRRRHADPGRHQPLRGRRGRRFPARAGSRGCRHREYDPELLFYRGVATAPVIDRITALDFVSTWS
jgi:hypothetical protein